MGEMSSHRAGVLLGEIIDDRGHDHLFTAAPQKRPQQTHEARWSEHAEASNAAAMPLQTLSHPPVGEALGDLFFKFADGPVAYDGVALLARTPS